MTLEETRPGLGTELPHGALLSARSGKHVLVTQNTRGSASLVLQHPPSVTSQREGLKSQAGGQPNPNELCHTGYPASASLQSGHKVVLLRPWRPQTPPGRPAPPRPPRAGRPGGTQEIMIK